MATEQSVKEPNLVFRMATVKGDLVMTWREDLLEINGILATNVERERLKAWAKEHNLKIKGKLEHRASITAKAEELAAALKALVDQDIGAAGFMVYGVTKEGQGSVLAKGDYKLEDLKDVAKVPAIRGG